MFLMTKIFRVNPVNPEMQIIREAARIIKSGGTVAFPTETIYGIGADAFNADACGSIFRIKNRMPDNPLIVHISKIEQLDDVATGITEEFVKTAKILWPGPVTFILNKTPKVPYAVTAGLDTVAVRMPAHPIALRLIEESGVPIAAPSANTSERPSPTNAEHVLMDLDGKVDAIIDGGSCAFGLESTIINMTVKPYVLLRPGAFTVEELEKYLGKIEIPKYINYGTTGLEVALAPGMKYRHYSPDKPLVVVENGNLLKELEGMPTRKRIAVLCSNEVANTMAGGINVIRLGNESDLYGIAKNLFDAFRKLDRTDADIAFIQAFSKRGIGLAIMNRMLRASGTKSVSTLEELKAHL